MAIDADTVNAYGEAAITAMRAGDWAAAKIELMALQTAVISLPDIEIERNRVQFSRDQIAGMLRECDRHLPVATGIQRKTITYA